MGMKQLGQSMTPELQRYYEDRLSMMASDAWNDLMEDVETMLKATDTLSGVTQDNFRFKQGEVSIMKWLLSLRDTSTKAYEELQLEDVE
jgi:hypothetical protein